MSTIDTCRDAHVLRPVRGVVRTAILSSVALITPIFAALYLLTVPQGTWGTVLAVHVLLTLGCTVVTRGLCRSRIWFEPRALVLRGPLGGRHSVARDRIQQLLLVQLYRGHTLDTEPQLFVVTDDGRTGLRLRGWLWSRDSMRRLAQELDMAITLVPEPMTLKELRGLHPRLLPILERRGALRVAAVAVAVGLVALVAAAILGAVGLPGAVRL